MKDNIHPQYNKNVKVTCSCGNTFEVGSTAQSIEAEVCSACHPFYTGTAKFIDTAGRVDKFQAKVKEAALRQAEMKTKKSNRPKADQPQAGKSKNTKKAD